MVPEDMDSEDSFIKSDERVGQVENEICRQGKMTMATRRKARQRSQGTCHQLRLLYRRLLHGFIREIERPAIAKILEHSQLPTNLYSSLSLYYNLSFFGRNPRYKSIS